MDYKRIVNQVVVGVAVAVLASAAHAITIYVDDDNCPGPGSGTEGDPYCSIQVAIDNAVDTDEIVVAPGTYLETINFLGKSVTLRSSDGLDVTIIDAQHASRVVTCNSGEGPDTVLEGFTITGGQASGGGGMWNNSSSPTVSNCRFSGSQATYGGGMWNNSSSPTVTNCTFSGNVADSEEGGGMFNWHSSNPAVNNCTFTGNTAGDLGGGMCNWDNSSPTVTDCTFVGNSAVWGGGIASWNSSNLTVTDCTFDGNTAERGAGMYIDTGSLKLINCTFINHLSGGSLYVGEGTINACPSDSDGNGAVDVIDFLALLANWGPCP